MIKENIKLALASLRANKLRSILTMLGIIIGIMAITSIVFIGKAMTSSVSKELSSFGSRKIFINIQKKDSDMIFYEDLNIEDSNELQSNTVKPKSDDLISDSMISEIINKFPNDIEGVSVSQQKNQAQAKEGDEYANISILGVNEDYFKANSIKMISGNFISNQDIENYNNAAVVSDLFVKNLFPNEENILGRDVKVYSKDSIELFQIIGIYKQDNSEAMEGMGSVKDMRTTFYIPLSTAKEDMIEKNHSSITVIGKDEKNIENFTATLQKHFDSLYEYNEDWKVSVSNMSSMIGMVTGTLKKISMAITAIAGISLLVGGIGVMNIMLVSVTERTREIGTKKALGAKRKHIELQFVIEAIIISFIGGIIGLTLGTIIGFIISLVFSVPFVFTPWVAIISISFSLFIGIFFGSYPAKKAAKLDPIEALRYE